MNLMSLARGLVLGITLCFCGAVWAGEITWIDVRTAGEFQQGHVDGALNIPYEEIGAGVAEQGLEKDGTIYLYCRSGRRAGVALEALQSLGYGDVVNLGGLDEALAEAARPTPE